jgi:hypothetical protein
MQHRENHFGNEPRTAAVDHGRPRIDPAHLERSRLGRAPHLDVGQHGCIRLSNQNIVKLFEVTTQPRLQNTPLTIIIT